MKKHLLILSAIGLVFSIVNSTMAQNIKKYSGEKSVSLPGGIYRSLDCQETYDYYIGDDGSYVKSGNYSLKGSANQIKGNVNATYSVTASYKNGLLNGHLSARVTVKGRGDYNYSFHDYDQYNVDYTLSANFKDGIPDGQWTYSETGMLQEDQSIHKSTFNCKNGVFVGDFSCNFSSMKFPATQKGKFDQNGKLLSIIIQGGGAGSKAGVGVGNVGMKEYNMYSNGDLISYFLRDEGKVIDRIQSNETLLKEYHEQNLTSMASFIKEKGYYLTRTESSKKTITYSSYTFGTLTILDYIWEKLVLQKSIDGVKLSDGFFNSYQYNICDIKKTPVLPLTETQLSEILAYIKQSFKNYDESLDATGIVEACKNDNHIYKENDIVLINLKDTLRYFDDPQLVLFQDSVSRMWSDFIEAQRIEKEQRIQKAKKELPNDVRTEVAEMLDEVVSWPIDAFDDQYRIERYYDTHPEKTRIWTCFATDQKQSNGLPTAMNKFRKFHKVISYNIDDIHITSNYDTCLVTLTINKKNKDLYGYKTYKSEALFLCSISLKDGYLYRKLDIRNSFDKFEHIYNSWDSVNNLVNTSTKLDEQLKAAAESFQSVYKSYSETNSPFKGDEDNPKEQYDYWSNAITIQNNYLRFIELAKQTNTISEEITLKATEYADIAEAYQNVKTAWTTDVNGKIADEIKRLEGYRTIQDSCLTFIGLRQAITRNNTTIADYSKTAPTIVKTYNTYMKGTDLTWNPEPGRNQVIREIKDTQSNLIAVLSNPNIIEIDKMVKKSKAKTWEDVKKIVMQ